MEGPIAGTPDFIPTLVLPDIVNRSNFEYSAFSGLKLDSWRRKKKEIRKKTKKMKNSIQVEANEHNQKKMC